jgi:hypothetical protein
LRPTVQPVLDRVRQAGFGRRTAGLDLAELAAAGRALLAGRTLTRPQVGRLLAERWPDRDPNALAWSLQFLLPLVHPPRAAPGARSAPPPSPWPKTGSAPRWRQRPHRGSWSVAERDRSALAEEGAHLLAFATDGGNHDIQLTTPLIVTVPGGVGCGRRVGSERGPC